jgi:hypothetical protein
MGISFLFLTLLQQPAAFAEVSRCDKISAEFHELEKLSPKACEESRAVHRQFVAAFPEVNSHCRRLESRANGSPTKLKLGTREEMIAEASAIRQADLKERFDLSEKVAHQLLLTPIDTDAPARPPMMVAEACRNELDDYAKFRRIVLTAISRFFQAIDLHDETLFPQAAERALPPAAAAVKEPGR